MRKLQFAAIAAVGLGLGLAGQANAYTCVGGSFAPDDPGECPSTQPSLITVDTTWCDGVNTGPIILNEPVFVVNGATLTINAGCIVRGQPRQADAALMQVPGSPGALIITSTGRINAQGTATNPIIFTTAATDDTDDPACTAGAGDDNPDDCDANPGQFDPWSNGDTFYDADPANQVRPPLSANGKENVQLWGGVVLLGNAPTNLANLNGVGLGRGIVEGVEIPGFPLAASAYGGVNPHDSSGALRYASIRYAGDEIGQDNELNCLSIAGVGDGTQLDHIDCFLNFDDGYEFFGGTADTQFLVSTYIGDDSFDLDQGFTGVGEFWFAMMPTFNEDNADAFGSKSGDKCGEWDGDDYVPIPADPTIHNTSTRFQQPGTGLAGAIEGTPWPLSFPTVYNLTCIGSTPGVAVGQVAPGANPAVSPAADNTGVQMRNGYNGYLFNALLVNFGTKPALDVVDGDTSIAGFDTCTNNVLKGTGPGEYPSNLTVAVGATTIADAPAAGASCAAVGGNSAQALANGDALVDYWGFTSGSFDNCVNPASGFFQFNGLQQEWTAIDPKGGADHMLDVTDNPAGKIDPRPEATSATCLAGINPIHSETSRLDGIPFSGQPGDPVQAGAAAFRGAFPGGATLWTTGWTAMSKAGLL